MHPRGQFETSVDAGSNETALKRAEPERSRAAIGLLVAVAALLALPLQALAQTTHVSNLGQSPYTSFTLQGDRSQSFKTGSNATGYTLGAVWIESRGTVSFNAAIWETDSDGAPSTLLHTLTAPTTFASGTLVFTAPAAATLAKDTTYGVRIIIASGTTVLLGRTTSDGEDAGGSGGWEIGDVYHFWNETTNAWALAGSAQSLGIAILSAEGTVDTTPPALATGHLVALTGNAIQIEFDEALEGDAALAPPPSAFTVKADGVTIPVTTVTPRFLLSRTRLGLVLGEVIAQGQTATVSYTDPTAGNDAIALQDEAGNDVATFTDLALINSSTVDLTPPALATGHLVALTGNAIQIEFDEDLEGDAALAPPPSAFTVKADGVTIPVTTVTPRFLLSRTRLGLVLGGIIAQGQTATVSYTDPTAGNDAIALQDEAGNDVATFTDLALINSSTVSTDATLSDLVLKNAADDRAFALSPTFVTGQKNYIAAVAYGVMSITLDPTKSDNDATVAYLDHLNMALADADTTKAGFQVTLATGANTIKVKVTAEAGAAYTDTYTVVVTREASAPTVTISADKTSAAFKVDDITYTLTHSGLTTAAVPVTVTLTQTKDFLLAADRTQSVTIPAGQSAATFTVAAASFQRFAAGATVEDGTLTATVQDGTGYDLGTPASVGVAIAIGVTIRIDQASYTVSEAANLTVKAIARTRPGAPQPTSNTSRMFHDFTDGTAIEFTDFESIDADSVDFIPSDYSLQSDGAWQAENPFFISVTHDDLDEDDETFTLTLEYGDANTDHTPQVDTSGNSCGTKCEVTVTITDDDTAGVTVSKTALTVTEQDTTGDSYTVVLDSQPTADVTITIGGHSGTDVTAAPSPLTFTPMNWATARTVTVTAADDIDTATDTVTLTHTATSTDPDYDAVAASVTVTVNDNDTTNTAPTFPSSTAARSVDENTAAGQNVGAVLTATDSDSDTLTYTLEGTDAASFDLVTTTDPAAQLRTKTGVTYNHEAKSTYTVVVKADDGNGGTDTVTVTITVTDVDEAPGRPAAPNVSATSGSTTSLDASWTEPTNTGPDIDDYDLRYREGTSGDWTDGPQNVAGTSSAIGSLMANTSHQVQVRATNDEGDGNWSQRGTGTTGTPANNAPVFADSTADRSVAENTAAGQNVGAVLTATDADGDPLTYTLEGADAASFDIVAVTGSGRIRTKSGATYDHEAKSGYSVTVRASDGTDSDTIAVAITVTDVTEAPGRPAAPNVSATSGSTTSLDVGWTAPTNTGPDIDDYDLRYREGTGGSWTDGPQNVAGTSSAIGSLMANTSHQVQVRATSDEGDGDWSQSGTGTTGTPANNAPVFADSTADRSVAENTAAGQNVGAVLTATDADGDPLTYTLEGADAASFDIVAVTGSGRIRTKSGTTYDHEAKSGYSVTVRASDGTDSDTIAVAITVTDVTEAPGRPAAPNVSATSGSTTSLDVGWTAPANTGPDIDDYDLRYREGTSGSFTDGPRNMTGTSAAIGSLDAGTAYQVQVRATNAEGDGNWSQSGSGTTGTAATPGVTVSESSLTVTEEDTTGETYTVVLDSQPTANVAVTVAGHAGTDVTPSPTALTFTTGDWGTPRTVTVTAGDDADTADDSVTLTHGATSADAGYDGIAIAGVAVTVRDDDTANNAPVFDDGAATTRSFAETIGAATVGASVEFGTPVTATDGDGDTPTYGIGGTDAARFGVDASTGRLRRNTGESYDHETRASYDVTVTADDGNGGTASIEVTIVIDDEAEAPPAPAAPTVTAVGTTGLAVAWSAPDNAGRPAIADYDLRRRAPGGAWTDGPQDIAGTAASITDLAPGTEYEVQVRATNADGDGPWSAAGSGTTGGAATHRVHLFAAASDPRRQGFVRVVNHATTTDAAVTIEAVDDAGVRTGPATLGVGAAAAAHFNSDDLGHGNPAKNLSGGIGDGGTGDRRLELTAEADVEVLSYMRTPDGFVTSLHDAVPVEAGVHRVAFFNPASNVDQASRLRIVNLGTDTATATVAGVDDAGAASGEVAVEIPAESAVDLTSAELEAGTAGNGALGDGAGKWRLEVTSDADLVVMSLLEGTAGFLTNLSTVPAAAADGVHAVPLFPSFSGSVRQGFVRVVNHADAEAEVSIAAFDESDRDYPTPTLTIGANRVAHFNSTDLEMGNPDKGLAGGTGAGEGDWRLELTSDAAIEVLSYIRTGEGFLTSMHDVVPGTENRHRVVFFNPGRNVNQVSRLRMANAGADPATVTITATDDSGASPAALGTSVPAGGVRTFSALDLEAGAADLDGALGPGVGKWRLLVESDVPITVMSILESPMGHLTNLSSTTRAAP